MANLSKILPIYDVTPKGIIIGDTKGALTVCFEMSLPFVFTLGEDQYEDMIEKFRNFLELLGDGIVVHKQDIYHRAYYSAVNEDNIDVNKDFIDRSYQVHFNERPYLKSQTYLYVSKFDEGTVSSTKFLSNAYVGIDEDKFISQVMTAGEVLRPYISLRPINKDELLSPQSSILKYYNFSNSNVDEMKDVSFENNSLYVGQKEVHIYTIENLKQFPTESIGYAKPYNGLDVSNMFPFSFPLDVPHITNQYIYIPNQEALSVYLDKQKNNLERFGLSSANNSAAQDVADFQFKMSQLRLKGVYYHFNIMCFDDTYSNIERRVNLNFAESGFQKKENTLSRKDLFLAGIPGNAVRMATQKDYLMSLIVDLEASAFTIWEQNYSDDIIGDNKVGYKGVKLCDRIYGIPFLVDLFDEPKKKGWINNQNAIVLAGSGGGKSYTTNLILLNMYRQGAHIFVIDASYSYKLQTAMHDGVYLTFDDSNRITFNPFYLSWLKNAKQLFNNYNIDVFESLEAKYEMTDDCLLDKYANWLEDKIVVISGLLAVMTKNEGETLTKFEDNVYRELIYEYFKDSCLKGTTEQASFDDFYRFAKEELQNLLYKSNITSFNVPEFLFMLKPFQSGNSLGYLLNSMDEKIKNIDKERFVVIDVAKIRNNNTLFSIVSTLAMDLYNQKIAKLPLSTKKIICIDEAWQAIASPKMAIFMKAQVKIIRKYKGQSIFISQELDDFISSEIIKESIVNNSDIKIFADMGSFSHKFEPIKIALAISDNNEKKIKSLNKNNRPNAIYKEVCICLGQMGQVYAVETPLELKAIFETDADEVTKILPQYEKYGVELTAINYANRD